MIISYFTSHGLIYYNWCEYIIIIKSSNNITKPIGKLKPINQGIDFAKIDVNTNKYEVYNV